MGPAERLAAFERRELSYDDCCLWAALFPGEPPTIDGELCVFVCTRCGHPLSGPHDVCTSAMHVAADRKQALCRHFSCGKRKHRTGDTTISVVCSTS